MNFGINVIKFLSLIFLCISASSITVLYIAKTISNLQINLKFFQQLSYNFIILIFSIFFMYFSVIFFHYNRNYVISKIKHFLNNIVLERGLKVAVVLNNRYNSNIAGQDIVANFGVLEKFFTKNIDKSFYLPWIFIYLFFLYRLNRGIYKISISLVAIGICAKMISLLFSYLEKKNDVIKKQGQMMPNINVFYQAILANIDSLKGFRFYTMPGQGASSVLPYFLSFLRSINVICIILYSSFFLRHSIQNIIIVYILTNQIMFFLEKVLSFELNYVQIKKIILFFKDMDKMESGKFFTKLNTGIEKRLNADNLDILVSGVYFKYHEIAHYVLNNLSINIYKNKTHLILGKNNSGKSTLMKLFSGCLGFQNGIVVKRSTSTICFCDDNLLYFDRLNFLSNVLIFNDNQEADKEFISFVLKSFNLMEDVKHYPGHLKCTIKDGSRISISLKRKISIVRTILSNRDILIFDTQMEGIDLEFITQLKLVLARLKKTVIIAGNEAIFSDFVDIVYNLEKN